MLCGNDSQTFFSPSGRPTHRSSFFLSSVRCVGISDGDPLTGASNTGDVFRVGMTGGMSSVINNFRPSSMLITPSVSLRLQRRAVTPKRNASVNLHVTGVVLSAVFDMVEVC